ncbi:MAG: serine/threonine-protein phosphatase [SAR324 cluster bacterium]|nr:serine/threonine-protein phosphatase [SAR324 cluster bacterium]
MQNTEDDALQVSTHLITSLQLDQSTFQKETFGSNFSKEVGILKEHFHLMKVKVFSKKGEVLFSTGSEKVGEMNENSYFHDIVAKGHFYTKVVLKDTKSLENQKVALDVVETYVPIMRNNQFIGAFELYYDITEKKDKIDQLLWISWTVLFTISLLLAIGFGWSVWQLDIHINLRKFVEDKLRKRNNQMQEELNLGREFQQKILPELQHFPYLIISKKYLPYGEVSGDTYDISKTREGTMNFFLGDATGHGVSAAFMTMMVQIGLDNIKYNLPTDEVMRQINTSLTSHETEKFITGIFFRITSEGFLTTSNGAHPPLIILPADLTGPVVLKESGSLIGAFAEELVPFVEETYQLQPNDRIFVYTDGLPEWTNKQGNEFGLERLMDFLKSNRTLDMDVILDNLLEHVLDLSEGNECGDDLTMFMFQYIGSGHSSRQTVS